MSYIVPRKTQILIYHTTSRSDFVLKLETLKQTHYVHGDIGNIQHLQPHKNDIS
jgi:hypothetical protein